MRSRQSRCDRFEAAVRIVRVCVFMQDGPDVRIMCGVRVSLVAGRRGDQPDWSVTVQLYSIKLRYGDRSGVGQYGSEKLQ